MESLQGLCDHSLHSLLNLHCNRHCTGHLQIAHELISIGVILEKKESLYLSLDIVIQELE